MGFALQNRGAGFSLRERHPNRLRAGSGRSTHVAIESRAPEAALRRLSGMGHELTLQAPYSQEMGRVQAILYDSATRTNYAASDPRADGAAVPEPLKILR